MEEKNEKRVKGCLAGIAFFLLFCLVMSMCFGDSDEEQTTSSPQSAELQQQSNWEYSQSFDEMNETTIYAATCTSTNMHEFDFPYSGGSVLYLVVRSMNGKNDVYLKVSKGQVMTSISGSEYARFKFDDGKPESYSYSSADDGSSEYAFLNASGRLIEKIKKAKHIKIDLPFFQAGRPVFDFDVEGLEWNR